MAIRVIYFFRSKGEHFHGFIEFSDQFPSIGPTYIHFYETSRKSNYLGRLLLSISCDVDARTTDTMQYDVQEILPLLEVKLILCYDYIRKNNNELRLTSGLSKLFTYAWFYLVLFTSKIITPECERMFVLRSSTRTVWNSHWYHTRRMENVRILHPSLRSHK